MKPISKSQIILGAAMLVTLALPFVLRPGGDDTGSAGTNLTKTDRRLVIITPHWEGIRHEFSRAFGAWTRERLGEAVVIDWLDVGGTSDAIRYVRSEFARAPEGIDIDIFFGGGVDPFMQLAKDDLLRPLALPPEVLAPIPPTYAGIEVYDPQHRWFGAALAGFGILYNRKVCERVGLQIPGTWADLGRVENLSWVGSGDPRSSGSVHMAYEIILQAYGWTRGWDVITRMCGNTRNFARGGSEVPKDTAVGEVAFGSCIDVYAWRQVAEAGADRMGFVLPDGLTVINPDGIGVLKGAPDAELATLFVEFVLTAPGQKLWCLKRGVPGGPQQFELDRMPVIPAFAAQFTDDAAVSYDPYSWRSGFTYDPAKGSLRWVILNDLLGATMIDTHAELVAAWERVAARPEGDARRQALLRPPLAEAELLELAETRWGDAGFRAERRAQWANEARERYRRIAGDASW